MVNNSQTLGFQRVVIDYYDNSAVINPNLDILLSLNRFFIFSSCNFIILYLSYMVGYPIFSHWFYHLCVIIKYSAKKIKNLCVRSIEKFNNLCVHTNTRKVDIASWGTPSPSSAIYNFGHSVCGRAIGT